MGPSVVLLLLCTAAGVDAGPSLMDSIWTFVRDAFSFIFKPLVDKVVGGTGKSTSAGRVTYRNYQLLQVTPRGEEDLTNLEGLADEGVLLWGRLVVNRSLDIVVAPSLVADVKEFLAEYGLDYRVLSVNVQKLINEQNPKLNTSGIAELKSTNGYGMTWKKYHRFSDMMEYLEYLQTSYPNLVEILSLGRSTEGRPLKVVKISSNSSRKASKQSIWIDGGMHGREWISPAVAMYIIRELVDNYARNRVIVDSLVWYIMPVLNPDGYEYSHMSDRLWRKSRSVLESVSENRGRFFWISSDDDCKGVDLNRNWDFHWGEKGASDDPCRETYAGARAFSEPETKAVADFITENKDTMAVYLTLHSYSQMWLVPWSYTEKKVKDYDDLVYMGRKAIEALKKAYGTAYELGTSTSLLYPTSGSSDDWAKGAAGVKYSYTVELRDRGSYGFLLPASQITPTGKETFAAVRAIARSVIREYG